MDLARRQDELVSAAVEPGADLPDPLLTIRPAGLLLPDAMRSGALSFSAGFSGTGSKGPVELDGRAVTNDQLVNSACGATPCKLGEIRFGPQRAPVRAQLRDLPATHADRGASLCREKLDTGRRLPRFFARRSRRSGTERKRPPLHFQLGRHAILPLNLLPCSPAHVRLGAGLSAPTGQAGRKLNGKTDYVGYSLQTGSGSWDAIAAP